MTTQSPLSAGFSIYTMINNRMKNNYNITKARVLNIKSMVDVTKWIYRFSHEAQRTTSVRKPENLVEGCDSNTWIVGKRTTSSENGQPVWVFEYDSVNIFNVSILRLAAEMFDEMTTEQILDCTFTDFIDIAKFYPDVKKRNLLMIINKVKSIVNNS